MGQTTSSTRSGRSSVAVALLVALVLAVTGVAVAGSAGAQTDDDVDAIAQQLEQDGYFIERGATADPGAFQRLVSGSYRDTWYFVEMVADVDDDFADRLREQVSPTGNVVVLFTETEGGEIFDVAQISTSQSESVEDDALEALFGDWSTPAEFMADVVSRFERNTAATNSSATGSADGSSSPSADGSGSSSGSGWLFLAVPAALIAGGMWFSGRNKKKKQSAAQLETATKIRAEIQTELDELANDVLVLGGPVDLSEKPEAIAHYREATATYTQISDELPDISELAEADLEELVALGTRIAHARWQMDAAEAMANGEPIPEKPPVEPPPEPTRPSPQQPAPRPERLPQQAPRPRVPYSRSRRRSGGGLLDILIAGSGMLGGSRRSSRRSTRSSGGMFGGSSGGMFGGSSGGMFGGLGRGSQSGRSTRQAPRSSRGGGLFGSGSSARSSSRSSSSRRSSSRSSSRRSSSARRSRSSRSRSTSRRRKR